MAQVRALSGAAAEVDPLFGLYVRVMVATGARRAELCALRWSDVDFEAGTLSVARSYTVVPGVRGNRPTKTTTRLVILDPVTLEGLRSGLVHSVGLAEQCGIAADVRRAGYVFTDDPTGATAWRPDTANARWVKARLAVGLTGVRLHDLRHFQATQFRRWSARANCGSSVGARRRHHHHEDLRTPHPSSRPTGRRRRRTFARLIVGTDE